MQVVEASTEADMVATFLRGELTSDRFGADVRHALAAAGWSEQLVTDADLSDERENQARGDLLGTTRGYRRNHDLFDADFPTSVEWRWAMLRPDELARVRYVYYDYWNELSGHTRLARDAAVRIRAGYQAYDVPNDRFLAAARSLAGGAVFPPMILVGPSADDLVCLEGNLRLTAVALAGYPSSLRCLVGTHPQLSRWAR